MTLLRPAPRHRPDDDEAQVAFWRLLLAGLLVVLGLLLPGGLPSPSRRRASRPRGRPRREPLPNPDAERGA